MPTAWRLIAEQWSESAFSGDGSVLASGRWHHAGIRCVYTSATPALAALEVMVHSGGGRPTIPFVIFEVHIPDHVAVEDVPDDLLSPGWQHFPGPAHLADCGSKWLERNATAVLRVPSAVSPREFNFLLNPVHPEFRRLVISPPQPFAFDHRLIAGEITEAQ